MQLFKPMLNFNDTKIAFLQKSNTELKKAYWLFKMIGVQWLSKLGTVSLSLALKLRLPVKSLVRQTVFEHFCGGESIEDCEDRIQLLARQNVKTILDYSVEGKQADADFDHTLGKAVASIERASKDRNIPFCVSKLTGLIPFNVLEKVSSGAELTDEEGLAFVKGRNRVDIICQKAYNSNIPYLIDAEESWIQPAIDEIALIMMHRYNKERPIVFNTAQLYRHDRLQYIKDLYKQSLEYQFFLGIKIVRGAYIEKERERAAKMGYEDPIQPTKEATDKDFDASIKFCLEHADRIALCCGTHNEESSLLLVREMKKHNMENDDPRIYSAQLLGMSDHISFNLSKENYNVAKYMPYGPVVEVMPYLIRRAEENTSIAGQTGRELSLIKAEMERRGI